MEPLAVAGGLDELSDGRLGMGEVTEAATLHLRFLMARLRLANCEFHQAERRLGELCAALTQAKPAQDGEPSDAAILASLPGVGQGTLATLLSEAGGSLARRNYAALRTLTGWRR